MGARLLTAGLAALALAGCGGGGGPEQPKASSTPTPAPERTAAAAPPDDEGEIYELLSDRAMSLEMGESHAFALSAVGPQRARDRRFARRAKRLSLAQVELVPAALDTSGDRAQARVMLSYRVKGMSRPFRTARRVTARKTDDGWRVTSDRPRREPLPWEVAGFRAIRTRHVVLLAAPGVDAAPLRSGLARAYREIRRDLPRRDLPRSVLVIAARDHRQAERLAGRIAKGVIAVANVAVEWGPRPALRVERVLAQRMIVIASTWGRQDALARQSTLVHEMTHTALDPDTSARTPPWLAEGVAMYVSNDDRTFEADARAAGAGPTIKLSAISRPGSIFRLGGRQQGAAYAASSAAAEEIVDRYGTKGLFRLYDAFNDRAIRGRPGARTTDRVLRRTLKLSLAELQAAIG
jgi:hypothetical protein